MSRATPVDVCVDIQEAAMRSGPPPQQPPQLQEKGQDESTDGSRPLFNKYLKIAEREDNKMTDNWKADADGILVFTGLFSASVAVLLAVSIGDLRPSPQDTSAFYLQNIYQLLSDPNRSDPTIPFTPSVPTPFSPPNYVVWVNSLWFLSLAMSLTCGFQATLLQQWARRYIKITQSPYSGPHERARIREFFRDGVTSLHVPWVVETLPTLLHISLFFFFAGLVIYLFNINHTVFTVVAWWVGFCAATYVGITLMPLFRHDSPYYAPLSSSAWYLVNGVVLGIFNSLNSLVRNLFGGEACYRLNLHGLVFGFRKRVHEGIMGAAERAANNRSSEADSSAIKCVLLSSDEDLHFEEFFTLILGVLRSNVIDSQDTFKNGFVSNYLLEWMDRTLSSHTLSDEVKDRRMGLCRKVMDTASLPFSGFSLICGLDYWDDFLCSIDSALILRAASYKDDPEALHCSNYAISIILARVHRRDDNWREVARSHLGVSQSVLEDYLSHGDSALLANLNCVIRRAIESRRLEMFGSRFTDRTLEWVSKIDVQGTLPELQRDFCARWNDLVLHSQNHVESFSYCPTQILSAIRHIYLTLHPSPASTTNVDHVSVEPSSYSFCTAADHQSGSASHIHGDVSVTTELPARISLTMFGGKIDFDTLTDVNALSSPAPSPYHTSLSPTPRRRSTSIMAPSVPAARISPVNDEDLPSSANPFDSTTTLVVRNGVYVDTIEHTANSHSHTSLLQAPSTPMLPLSSNRTDSSLQDEESIAVPLTTFSYPPYSSTPSSINNAPPASAFSSLRTSAGNHIPTIHVTASSDSDVTPMLTTVGLGEKGRDERDGTVSVAKEASQ